MCMKVAFYLHNKNIMRFSNLYSLEKGNPGIGGSEYMILLISKELTKRNNDIIVRLYIECDGIQDPDIDIRVCNNIETAAYYAAQECFNRFIFDSKQIDWYSKPFNNINNDLRLIPWCHNFPTPELCYLMAYHKNIGRIICVGREQMDLFRDSWAFNKMDYIYNCVPIPILRKNEAKLTPNTKRKHVVTYIGSLSPAKSFHVLAQLWKNILTKVPDAELYVIGDGRLYNRNCILGKYGLAEDKYERFFMQYLTVDGKIMPSVHFMGRMGEEKYDILSKTKVGVPNPMGKSETFCITAVEMQAMGAIVTALQAPGYYDTFYNGRICGNLKELENNIVKYLLYGSIKSQDKIWRYIDKNFSINSVIENWERLLLGDLSKHIHSINPLKNPVYRYKWIKEIIRLLKKNITLLSRKKITIEDILQKTHKLN